MAAGVGPIAGRPRRSRRRPAARRRRRARHADRRAARGARSGGPGPAAVLYLRHMIEHHLGAITMARSALDGGTNAYIRGLAGHIVNEQSAENEAMSRLLAERR
nr:DUF305 domain-containing protein [Actinoplanes sp. ATCC 53533]